MSSKILNTAVILVLGALSLAILANSMTKPLARDEQMYCTGGALLARGKAIYRDFSYPAQMPYHPLLYAALFRALNTTRFLLMGRLLSALCDVLVTACIIGIYRRLFRSFAVCGTLLGLAGALLYVFNPLVDYANGFAWNHDVVILCVCVSFWLFISVDSVRRARHWPIAVIGALLTLATFMRITTVLVQAVFFTFLLTRPADSTKQRLKTVMPFLIATAVVSVWPVWVIAQGWRAFLLNLFYIPVFYGEWLHRIGLTHSKFDLTLSSVMKPGYLAIVLIAIYLWAVVCHQRCKLSIPGKRASLLAALLPLTFFIIALIPPTMWKQYLAMPVPFLIVSLAYPLLYLRELTSRTGSKKLFNTAAGLVTTGALVAFGSQLVVVLRVGALFTPQSWIPVQLHSISEDIAAKTRDPKLILTLAPLFALEGEAGIYTELSAGSIVYRIADLMSPGERAITHTVGPETLKVLLEKSPPSAVVLGVEFEFLEDPLLQTAVGPDRARWERKMYENGPIVYFRR
jgi:hypothetical protein